MRAKALTIAGSDSGGGAGIQADLKTFHTYQVYGSSVITAITAQNTLGVQAFELVSPSLIERQIVAVLADIGADAIKTGMLGNATIIETVANSLRRYPVALVVDPVMVAKSGDRLLVEDAVQALREQLVPIASLITPNLPEASVLLGREIDDERTMYAALDDLLKLGAKAVLLKGGHLKGQPLDLFADGQQVLELRSERIDTPNTHGTGCTYAAAITALLARGADLVSAVCQAHAFLYEAIASAESIGAGHSPVNHWVWLSERTV
ncbi:bifunctional hydroxymethylpyrimidine kinase/phosphomethylpyrimidine kinase [Herpetosiphon gulosus]|uniref:Hydroxymethylpyrimidine/phosphomethylpyrimidine kinase n=1 Tax=Herpetosiphon gulosus TaxID=1973496 RepID=A0ABP9WY35_9CHLR